MSHSDDELSVSVRPEMAAPSRKSVTSGFNTQKGYLKDAIKAAEDLQKVSGEDLGKQVYQDAMRDALQRITDQLDKVKAKFMLVAETVGDDDQFFKAAEASMQELTGNQMNAADALRTLIARHPPTAAPVQPVPNPNGGGGGNPQNQQNQQNRNNQQNQA